MYVLIVCVCKLKRDDYCVFLIHVLCVSVLHVPIVTCTCTFFKRYVLQSYDTTQRHDKKLKQLFLYFLN